MRFCEVVCKYKASGKQHVRKRKYSYYPDGLPLMAHGNPGLVLVTRSFVPESLFTFRRKMHDNTFRMDWLDLAVQGTLKSLLQHQQFKSINSLHLTFFIVQLSHPYMTTGKTIALTRRTFVDKGMSLLFNVLSRFVITFHPRSKSLLISCLQSPSAVILEPKN